MKSLLLTVLCCLISLSQSGAADVWPDLAPGETTKNRGDLQPFRKQDAPPISALRTSRSQRIPSTWPRTPNGDLRGHFARRRLRQGRSRFGRDRVCNDLDKYGVSAFVVNYRTKSAGDPGWRKPLQDSQRMVSVVRSNAKEWGLNPGRVGLVGFSAGGQVAARHLCANERTYQPVDVNDEASYRPDFAMLIYPWNMYDTNTDRLHAGIDVADDCPQTFIVHTDDDNSTSLGAVLFYTGLKKHKIPAEMHVFVNGGHGYGTRPRPGSEIGTWPQQSVAWLRTRGLLE